MAHRKENSPELLKNGEIFFWDTWFFLHISYSLFISFRKVKIQLLGAFSGAKCKPKVGCFFKMFKIQLFCCFIPQLHFFGHLHFWGHHHFWLCLHSFLFLRSSSLFITVLWSWLYHLKSNKRTSFRYDAFFDSEPRTNTLKTWCVI